MIPKKPNNVRWSDEQWLAIHASGQNILVNAGAGSGKTAVLTERVIQILKKGVKLESLIVLTFTKAAASEMKQRIREALNKEVHEYPILLDALEYLDQAAIQTFDAFALEMVKRYHYLLGVDRNINIGDKVIFTVKKKAIIDEVFEEFYEEENEDFHKFISFYSVKHDENLKKYIYQIDKKIDLIADREYFLDHYLENYYHEDFINTAVNDFLKLLEIEVIRIKQRLERLKIRVQDETLVNHVADIEERLSGLLGCKRYEDYLNNIDVSLPMIPRKVDDEDEKVMVTYEKEQIKDLIKKIKSYLLYQSEAEMHQEIWSTKDQAKIIIDILKRVDVKYNEFKYAMNSYEFLDIAKLAIKLVRENGELREQIKSSIYEILIDEYQDTSDIQEILIGYLANNNVYMVGDIKQSIYRFRNANPDIFKDKYQDFKDNNTGLAIDLSKNFRSREEVLANINLVFSQVMSFELGGVDYNENHALVFGNKNYSKNRVNDNYHLEIYSYDYQEEELTNHEIEAFIIADDILHKIKNRYQIYDKDQDLVRDATFSDFTILASEKKQFELYKKIFEYKQIPLVIHKDEDFIRSSEIYVIKNILRAIYSLVDKKYYQDNFRDAVFSVLRSFLVEASDQDISLVFVGDAEQGLKLRFPEIYAHLMNLSQAIENHTASEILGQIYDSFKIYENIVKLGNVEQLEDKLNYLLAKFQEFDQLGYRIIDTITYLEAVLEEKLDIEFSSPMMIEENVVNMMTIHKSKGLEFPVCYFPELDNRFNFSDVQDRIIFDNQYGIIIPTFKEGLTDTFYKHLISQKFRREEISERMRVLYVALTRAKEKIIIVSSKFEESYKDDISLVPLVDRLNYRSLFSIVSSIKYSLQDYLKPVLVTGNKEYEKISNLNKLGIKETPSIEKHQVSLQKIEEKRTIASKGTNNLLTKETVLNMEFGTLIHKYLESLDFFSDIREQLTHVQINQNIKEKILKFFELDIFHKNIINTYHEHQFIVTINNEVVHGIIDLILETKEELIIIDYKLSDLAKEEYLHQLRIYQQYLETISPKKVTTYLYSIIKEELKLITFKERK